MDWDDVRKPMKPAIAVGEDLSNASIRDLEERILALTSEIARVETEMARKRAQQSAADSVFKRNSSG